MFQKIFEKLSRKRRTLKIADREVDILFRRDINKEYHKTLYVVSLSPHFSLDDLAKNTYANHYNGIRYLVKHLKPDLMIISKDGTLFNKFGEPIIYYKEDLRPKVKTLTLYTKETTEESKSKVISLAENDLFDYESLEAKVIDRKCRNRVRFLDRLEDYLTQLNNSEDASSLKAVRSDIFELPIIDVWDIYHSNYYSDVELERFYETIKFVNSVIKKRQEKENIKAVAIRTTCGNRMDYYRQILTAGATSGMSTSLNSTIQFVYSTGSNPDRGIIVTYLA